MVSYLQVENLTKSFGDLVLFEDLSFGVAEGQRIGLIAKNGTGNTTLLNILAGKEGYDEGKITYRRDLRVGYLEQHPYYPENLTVLEACFYHGNPTTQVIKEYEKCMETPGNPGLEELLGRMEHEKAWDYERRAKQILSQLKIRDFDQPISQLSGGQLKRVAMATVLIVEPDLLILAEPTNHLDLEMTEWLEEYLKRGSLRLLMVTHDRYFLDRVADKLFIIENGTWKRYYGDYSDYLAETLAVRSEKDDVKKSPAAAQSTGEAAPVARKVGLTARQEEELRRILEELPQYEGLLKGINAAIAAAGSDYEQVESLLKEQQETQRKVDELTERWCELEDLKAE